MSTASVVVDQPWKSPWRLNMERIFAESPKMAYKPKVQPKPRISRPRLTSKRLCAAGCGSTLSIHTQGDLCRVCIGVTRRKPKPEPRLCVTGCGKSLRSHNASGHCKKCYNRERRRIHAGPKPKCSGCDREINRNNMIGKCRACSRSHYQKTWKDKQ